MSNLLKYDRRKKIVPISPTTDIVVVDKNGYIGEKRPNGNTVYFGYLDSFADFSEKGLGQVTIIPVVIGEVTIGGRKYKTTKIGNQEWLAENLDYKFNVNGSQIPIGSSGDPTTPAAWYYNNDEASYGIDGTYKYGLLYNWYAAKYLDDNKATLLPSGWHVPSNSEFDTLATTLGGASIAGMLLKALDNSITSNWPSGWNGIDYRGFNAIPTGRYYNNEFYGAGSYNFFWTITTYNYDSAYKLMLTTSATSVLNETYIAFGYSLRLVKTLT